MKLKYSNFHVTVNTNKDDEDLVYAMRETIDELAFDPYLWKWLKQYDGRAQVAFTPENAPLVDSIRLRAAIEHGGENNRGLHAHILIEIAHDTMVQIYSNGIKDVFRHFLGFEPNVRCRFIKGAGDDKDFILHYITKEVPRRKSNNPANNRLAQAMRADDQQNVENYLPQI